jgi:hypothetical protein
MTDLSFFPVKRRWRAMIVLALLPLVAWGCGTPRPKEGQTFACPGAVVLGDAARVHAFRDGQTGGDLLYRAEFTGVKLECSPRSGGARADVRISIEAQQGPGVTASSQQIRYFVAVTRDEQILAKQNFNLTADFRGRRSINIEDRIRQIDIPLARGQRGSEFVVFVGFELTPEQLAYNRVMRR